jgi:hypothetical protein
MAQPNLALSPAVVDPQPVDAADDLGDLPGDPPAAWKDVVHLLRRAASLAAAHSSDTDLFMHAAWSACLDARPGLREQLEDKELRAQLKKLRKRGLVGAA